MDFPSIDDIYNTNILYNSNYPGNINNDLDDEYEKKIIDAHTEALIKINENNDIIEQADMLINIEDAPENINISEVEQISENNNDIPEDIYNLHTSINNTIIYNKNSHDLKNSYTNYYEQNYIPYDSMIIHDDEIDDGDDEIEDKYDENIILSKHDPIEKNSILTTVYGKINDDEKYKILKKENEVLKKKIINNETSKMNDFYNRFVNPDSSMFNIKKFILNYALEIDTELSMFDLNSLDEDRLNILHNSIVVMKKKESQIEFSAHIIKLFLLFLEKFTENYLQTSLFKNISNDLDINTNFNNTQTYLNNLISIPDFPFKDVFAHIFKKVFINLGYDIGYNKILNNIY
jgi:hypothetical protein